jgi:hypothetical protein
LDRRTAILSTAAQGKAGLSAGRRPLGLGDPECPLRGFETRAVTVAHRAGAAGPNDCDALKADPAFKSAVGRLPESGADLCSQPTISRLSLT